MIKSSAGARQMPRWTGSLATSSTGHLPERDREMGTMCYWHWPVLRRIASSKQSHRSHRQISDFRMTGWSSYGPRPMPASAVPAWLSTSWSLVSSIPLRMVVWYWPSANAQRPRKARLAAPLSVCSRSSFAPANPKAWDELQVALQRRSLKLGSRSQGNPLAGSTRMNPRDRDPTSAARAAGRRSTAARTGLPTRGSR